MKRIEDEMLLFSKPLFLSHDRIDLNPRQLRVLAIWISLITVLAEYIGRGRSTISLADRTFLKTKLIPPLHWSIIAASLESDVWRAKYRHSTSFIGDFSSREEYFSAVEGGRENNTQLSTFGMGKLFMQVFSCPNERIVSDFEAAARATGFIQIWPISSGIWTFNQRPAKFPSKLILKDEQANEVADAFFERMRIRTSPPYFGGQRGAT